MLGFVWYFMFRNSGGLGGASGRNGSPFNPFVSPFVSVCVYTICFNPFFSLT